MSTPDLKTLIRTVADFPKAGILFRDITTLLRDAAGFRTCIEQLAEAVAGMSFRRIVGIESRGFIVGAALAHHLGRGFVPIRKAGKLPAENFGHDYELEYGTDRVEIHADALAPDEPVLLVDDLLATGGTAVAACRLIAMTGARVAATAFVIELDGLGGRARLEALPVPVRSILTFTEE
ncbi:MAG TPA: adenine phosphoribosyltransferase [Burkholderiales bacterium]|nr:adenine phosphoribosyltransferase [Betaproteobacteria bacterium]HQR52094.1 adenine phosphoribosyltransferase [Burkholderiales bacterium]